MIVSDSGKSFTPCPAGTHFARCYGVVDLGTQTETFEGKVKNLRKVILMWELCGESTPDGQPMVIRKFYTASLGDKTTLQKDLQAWRGRPFTPEERSKFDISKLIGAGCMLTIIHETKDGNVRDRIAAVSALPKGTQLPEMRSARLYFYIPEWDQTVFDKLPEWIKAKITASPEGAAKLGYKPPPAAPANAAPNGYLPDATADDIPF